MNEAELNDLKTLDLLESRGREVHTSWSGIEIQRTFYFEPYEAYWRVLEALQGSVSTVEAWKRTPPAHDTYIDTCYCNEVRVTLTDPRIALGSSETIEVPDKLNAKKQLVKQTILEKLQDVHESPADGFAGGFITAIYRPLITAYVPTTDVQAFPTDEFDWMQPQFRPTFKQIPWPTGLRTFVAAGSISQEALTAIIAAAAAPLLAVAQAIGITGTHATIPPELADTVTIPVFEFSIRRLLVGVPPYDAIAWCAGKVNKNQKEKKTAFPQTNLPTFRDHTLRFDGADIEERLDSNGKQWFELTYHFAWIDHYSGDVYGTDGVLLDGSKPVTWNHVFMRPEFLGVSIAATGWWPVVRNTDRKFFGLPVPADLEKILQPGTGGSLYETADFMDLFKKPL